MTEQNRDGWGPFATDGAPLAAAPVIGVPDPGGMKYDRGKPRFDLLPPEAWTMGLTSADLEGVVRVLEFGARKYAAHSWQTVPEAERRYTAAAGRHTAHRLCEGGCALDAESGLPARWHNLCDAVFLFALASRALREGRWIP